MDANDQSQIEESLKKLSWWTGPEPRLWRKALSAHAKPGGAHRGRLIRIARSRWTWFGVPIAAMIALGVGIGLHETARRASCSANLIGLGSSYHSYAGHPEFGIWNGAYDASFTDGQANVGFSALGTPGEGERSGHYYKLVTGNKTPLTPKSFICPSTSGSDLGTSVASAGDSGVSDPGTLSRQVIRKAAVDLLAEDVRGTYLKVQMIPNDGEGEYVEQSQITGTDADLRGYVTLRVRSERLNTVIGSLRNLAEVSREQVEATDVTSQVVDVEARLRNERRVEQELLDLLDKRKDAPLADVLKVGESLAAVRGRIEQLVAQQQQLTRQVALAAILVTIGPKDRPVEKAGLSNKFSQSFSSAWSDGSSFLVASIAGIVRVLIGGLVWWLILAVVLWAARRRLLRYLAKRDAATA